MQVVTGNAACAIAARNSIFKVVPFAFVKPIYLAAKQTAVGDLTTLADRRTKMLSRFAALGVNEKRICASVEKGGVEEIGLGELETLIGVYSSIRDNEQTVDEAFPAPKTASEGIKFGPAGIPEPATESAPKRKRRTKAEMIEAAKLAEANESMQPEPMPEEVKDAMERLAPPLATPLEGLRNLLKASPISEEVLVKHLVQTMAIEPHQKLIHLSDEKIIQLTSEFMVIAGEILDGGKEEKEGPFQ
jgi:hypothetical protein